MFNKLRFFLISAIFLSACSSTNKVATVERKPDSITTLTIPVISDKWMAGQVRIAYKNTRGCGEFSNDILPDTSEQDFTLEIEGNRDMFFDISRSDTQVACKSAGTIYVTKGKTYLLNLEIKNNQCDISLIENTPNGAPYKLKIYPAYISIVDNIKVCENKKMLY